MVLNSGYNAANKGQDDVYHEIRCYHRLENSWSHASDMIGQYKGF